MGLRLPSGSSAVVRRLSSHGRRASQQVSPRPVSVHRRFVHRLGRISRRRPSLRLVVSPLSVFHQSPRASGGSVHSSGFPSFSSGTCGGGVLRQHHRLSVPQETGWYSFCHSQHGGSVSPQILRGFSHPASSAVHPRQDERPRRLSESQEPSHRFRVDSLCGGVSPASSPLTSHHRPPSITGCRSTSLRWWTLSRRVPTPCSRVGMAFRIMPFLPSASFLESWRRSDSPNGWN